MCYLCYLFSTYFKTFWTALQAKANNLKTTTWALVFLEILYIKQIID